MLSNNNEAVIASDNLLFENRIGLVTVDQLADALGYAPKTIRNWVAKRKIPFVRIGRRTMFRLESISTWLTRKESKSWR